MKIIKPSVEFYGPVPTDYASAIRFIEMAGRTCYKSEDKITEDSAEKFVMKLINAKPEPHLAMVEHSNFVVRTRRMDISESSIQHKVGKYLNVIDARDYTYVGGNLTAWYYQIIKQKSYSGVFNNFFHLWGRLFGLDNIVLSAGFDLSYQDWKVCPHDEIPKELHRYSAKFICDRGVSHELVRHRPCSFAQESTRYVNYADKDMEFIEPDGFEDWISSAQHIWRDNCLMSEKRYGDLIKLKASPQQARAVLPNALKTEIVVTADSAEWSHIRKLRTSSAAHPDMQRVMNMMPWEKFL